MKRPVLLKVRVSLDYNLTVVDRGLDAVGAFITKFAKRALDLDNALLDIDVYGLRYIYRFSANP